MEAAIKLLKQKSITEKKRYLLLNHTRSQKVYGTYTDPIYGIKVFNESISLKPSQKDTKVKTVFNGKVIYADKTPAS